MYYYMHTVHLNTPFATVLYHSEKAYTIPMVGECYDQHLNKIVPDDANRMFAAAQEVLDDILKQIRWFQG
jgi:hypothetical protein